MMKFQVNPSLPGKVGEVPSPLQVTVENSDTLDTLDLSAAEAVFSVFKEGSLFLSRSADVDAENGVVSFSWLSGDTSVPGVYHGFFRLQWPSGRVLIVPQKGSIKFEIEP